MNEVKKPERPIIFYYIVTLILLVAFNHLFMPYFESKQVKEVDYSTFIQQTEEKNVDKVSIKENQIVFTEKEDGGTYKTGRVNDPDLTKRLYESGAEFSGEIVEEMSPFMSILLSWVLPLLIFFAI